MARMLSFNQWLIVHYKGMTEERLKRLCPAAQRLIRSEYEVYKNKFLYYHEREQSKENYKEMFNELFEQA